MCYVYCMDSLSKLVVEFRNRLGDSQPKFAARLGVSARAIANYDAGRRPTRAVLWKIAKLAEHCGFADLHNIFSNAYFTAMDGLLKPIGRREQAWVRMILAVLRRSGSAADLQKVAESLLAMLETLALDSKQAGGADSEDLRLALAIARSEIFPRAEAKACRRAAWESRATGATRERAYAKVLLDDPELYAEVRAERLREKS